jgi:transcription initiation factor TFIIIB Brf1 subunit/transcription initiation factor TFIIB
MDIDMEFSRGPSFKTCRVSDEERLREFRERMD